MYTWQHTLIQQCQKYRVRSEYCCYYIVWFVWSGSSIVCYYTRWYLHCYLHSNRCCAECSGTIYVNSLPNTGAAVSYYNAEYSGVTIQHLQYTGASVSTYSAICSDTCLQSFTQNTSFVPSDPNDPLVCRTRFSFTCHNLFKYIHTNACLSMKTSVAHDVNYYCLILIERVISLLSLPLSFRCSLTVKSFYLSHRVSDHSIKCIHGNIPLFNKAINRDSAANTVATILNYLFDHVEHGSRLLHTL
jgi:hypothetical protein